MDLPRDAVLLRIFVEETDQHEGEPLFRKIALKAREMKLAGATVLRGPLGFGRSSQLHASSIFHLSGDLPIVSEIVDTEQKIREFLREVEEMVGASLITLEKVQAISYTGKKTTDPLSMANMPKVNPNRWHKESREGAPPPRRTGLREEAVLLRIFIGEDDHHRGLPLYEAIVLKAREMHVAGATVIRGVLGFGKSSHLHGAKFLRLSMDLPMVIEIVDAPENVNEFLPFLEPMMSGGLVTLERARVIPNRHYPAPKRMSR
jgi:uncharacterized protein